MKRLSLFNHEKRIALIERALERVIWQWVAIAWLAAAVLSLGYMIFMGSFP